MRCKVEKICGGCKNLCWNEKQQAEAKLKDVENIMERAGIQATIGNVHMAKHDTGYRNKVIVGFAKDKNKKVYSGLYAAHSHKVVNTKGCMMHPKLVNDIIDTITELIGSMKIELYNERTGTGLLRHVLIRYAQKTNEVMIAFVTAQKQFPSRRNMIHVLVEKYPQIVTVVQNVNPRHTSVVMENESIVLYGKGMITDELCGLKVSFSSRSFYQIHSEQCEVLYGIGKDMLKLKPTDKVLDTYCGVGTIGMTLANDCKEVTGVELNKEAVENAKFNARQNHLHNMHFVPMDSTRFMLDARRFNQHYDAIVLDPPRTGTTKPFIEAACSLSPKKILYISCDPRTQARDLIIFKRFGYYTDHIELVDMFPHTSHVESVCLLTKRRMRNNVSYEKAKEKTYNHSNQNQYKKAGKSSKSYKGNGQKRNTNSKGNNYRGKNSGSNKRSKKY